MGAAAAVVVGSMAALAGAVTGAPHAGQRVDMRVLLLANDAGDGNIAAWQDNLKREGVPFDLVTGASTLTAATFAEGDRAKYQAVIVSGPDGTAGGIPSQFSSAEFDLLRAFEQKFAIRQLDVNAYPGPPLGLNFPGSTGTLDGQTPTLTAAGLARFPALKGPVPFEDLDPAVSETFGASATPCDGVAVATCNATSFDTILQGPGGASLVGIAQTKDGREEMVATFSANQYQLHNALLRHSMLTWATRGVYLGMDRSYLAIDVDDVFVPDQKWDPAINGTPGDGTTTTGTEVGLRMTAADVTRLVNFQNTNSVKLNMLFNGFGVQDYKAANRGFLGLPGIDPLFNAFMANKAQVKWINHTWSHASLGSPNPENPTQAAIQAEISQNNQFAATNALPGYNPAELVTGEHSGIGTSKATALGPVVPPATNMPGALNAAGVTTVGADNSREVGQRRVGNAYTLPRYPTNLYYNVSTWTDQLDEYDWLYLDKNVPGARGNCTPPAQGGAYNCFTSPVTQAQFIQRESTAIVQRMLGNDPRPSYVHQSNAISDPNAAKVENRGNGILYSVLGQALANYRQYFTKPIQQPSMSALTQELRRQITWEAAVAAGQVSGYIEDGKVTITASAAVDVPLTGTTAGDLYAGQRSGWRGFTAGESVTLEPDDPRSTGAPAISGTASEGSTLTTSDGTWTGTPAIAYTRQWQRRASASAPWVDIPTATVSTYTVAAGDGGQDLRAVIGAGNRISSWSLATTAPVTIDGAVLPAPPPAATAPANTALPVISGTPKTTETLSSSTGTWTGTAPITYAYQWQRRTNTTGSAWSPINGATARTFRLRRADRGYLIRIVVTARNGVGSAQALAAPVGPVTAGGFLGRF